jgi:hypothetical protein
VSIIACFRGLKNTMAGKGNEPQTVSDKIIDKFLQTLGNEKGFDETAARLRKTVLEDKSTSEKQIRDALFGESEA